MSWMTVQQASVALGKSEKTIRRGIKAGEWEVMYEHNPKGGAIIKILVLDKNDWRD